LNLDHHDRDQLVLARDLAARWLPRRGRRARRRLGAGDVLGVIRAAQADASTLAVVEVRFVIEELLTRGRKPDRTRVTREDLIGGGDSDRGSGLRAVTSAVVLLSIGMVMDPTALRVDRRYRARSAARRSPSRVGSRTERV